MPPHFSTDVYYGQMAGWIRIPLRTEVRLGPGDTVLDGDPARSSTQRGAATPTYRPTALAGIPAGPHFTHNPYCRLGSARRAALMAILPDNCHPSSSISCGFVVDCLTDCGVQLVVQQNPQLIAYERSHCSFQ